MTGGGVSWKRVAARAADALAAPLVLVVPFAEFARSNGSPLSPEVLLCIAALALIGAAVSLATPSGSRRRAVCLAVLLFLFVDFQYDVVNGAARALMVLVLVVGAALLLRRHVAVITTTFFGALLVALLVTRFRPGVTSSGGAPPRPAQDLPVVVHLILDEHMGVEGIPPEFDPDGAVARKLQETYVGNGFRLFSRAYSRYYDTFESISNVMNLSASDVENSWFSGEFVGGRSMPMRANRYLRTMASRGYSVHVFQSDFMVLCSTLDGFRAERCDSYVVKKVAPVAGAPLPLWDKIRLIAGNYRRLSWTFGRLDKVRWDVKRRLAARDGARPRERGSVKVTGIASMPEIERLKDALAHARPGDMFLAHVLLPHFPYVYDASCTPRPQAEWLEGASRGAAPDRNTASSRARRYPLYLEQVACTTRKVGELFDALRTSGHFDDAVVIVHGDHGSRLLLVDPKASNAARLSKADLVDGFSTLFAVKAPGWPAGVDRRVAPLDELLGAVVKPGSRADALEPPPRPEVLLAGEGRSMTAVPMPEFGEEARAADERGPADASALSAPATRTRRRTSASRPRSRSTSFPSTR